MRNNGSSDKKNRSKSFKKIMLTLLLVIGITTVAVLYYSFRNKEKPQAPPSIAANGDYLNLQPPTKEDKQAVEETKKDIATKQDNPSAVQPSSATVVVTRASQYDVTIEAAGYAQNIFEDGGTCAYTFTKNNLKVVKSTVAFKDVRTTNCTPVEINRNEFSEAGTWQLVLSYTSTKIKGSSISRPMEIQ